MSLDHPLALVPCPVSGQTAVPVAAATHAFRQALADELQGWVNDTGIDGFNLARTVTPECFEDVVGLVVPELQSRGAYKTGYAQGTLRE